jgi:hypothetical protein
MRTLESVGAGRFGTGPNAIGFGTRRSGATPDLRRVPRSRWRRRLRQGRRQPSRSGLPRRPRPARRRPRRCRRGPLLRRAVTHRTSAQRQARAVHARRGSKLQRRPRSLLAVGPLHRARRLRMQTRFRAEPHLRPLQTGHSIASVRLFLGANPLNRARSPSLGVPSVPQPAPPRFCRRAWPPDRTTPATTSDPSRSLAKPGSKISESP